MKVRCIKNRNLDGLLTTNKIYDVVILGGGPAGLAAAQQLARAGHSVTVFEKNDRVGGLLRYGIPDFKMDKSHIDKRVKQMEAEGVVFKTATLVEGLGKGSKVTDFS